MDGMGVGMNLDWITDYAPAWVFKDAFQQSRTWMAWDYNTVTGAQTQGTRPVQLDANGWPRELTTWTNDQGQFMQQRLQAVTYLSTGGAHPAGVYHAEWRGAGTLTFLGDGAVLSRGTRPDGVNLAELNVVTPTNAGIHVRIDSMSSTDPIRDLHVWMPDYNGESFRGQGWRPGADFSPFHPLFTERLRPFETIRFMQAANTITSDIVHWEDSRPLTHARQANFATDFQNGMSPEYMIALANELDANPYFNMPHLAEDDYVRRFAELARDTLNPNLTIYVEWSNEVWNWAPGFESHYESRARAAAEGISLEEYVARETRRDFDIWSDVFAGQEQRLVRTVGGFVAAPGQYGWNAQLLSRMQGRFDALAIAPYVSPPLTIRNGYTASTTVDQVLADTQANIVPMADMVRQSTNLLRQYETQLGRDLQLIAYEGGTHLDDRNAVYQQAFFNAAADPRMYDILTEYLDAMADAGIDEYLHYKFTDRRVSALINDDFGTLNRMDQPLETAHRYRALLDYIAANPDEPVVPANQPPMIASPGDQMLVEGSTLMLTMTASDPDGGTLTYSLDAAPAGAIIDPATGQLTFTALDGPAVFALTVRVTDSGSPALSATATFAINVTNAAPQDLAITGPNGGMRGQPMNFSGSFFDPGLADTHTLSWQVTDGTGAVINQGSGSTMQFTPATTGSFTVAFTVVDDDGAAATARMPITVSAAALIADPEDPTRTALLVYGTAGNDQIAFMPTATGGQIRVVHNGVAIGTFSPTGRIIAFGLAGNDDIKLHTSLSIRAEFHGGDGNDRMMGGLGPDLLLGDAGDDQLQGNEGRDLLIGGTGSDVLYAGADDDLLIAGRTSHDDNEAALRQIMAEWTSARTFAERVANLRGMDAGPAFAARRNGDAFLQADGPAATVFDDLARATIYSGRDYDWLLADLDGLVRDTTYGLATLTSDVD